MRARIAALVFFACAIVSGALSSAAAETKRALVIGVSYSAAPDSMRLKNAANDARLFDGAMRTIKARRTMLIDPSLAQLDRGFSAFAASIRPGDTVIFHYAGHGVQAGGRNYILSNEASALIDVTHMIETLRQRAGQGPVIVFLDACRNNPFAPGHTSGGARGVGARALTLLPIDSPGLTAALAQGGLAEFQAQGANLKIVFATDPNAVASDGVDDNSPFTAALAREIVQSKPLDDVIAAVTRDVSAATGGRQTPWQQGSLSQSLNLAGRRALPTF